MQIKNQSFFLVKNNKQTLMNHIVESDVKNHIINVAGRSFKYAVLILFVSLCIC